MKKIHIALVASLFVMSLLVCANASQIKWELPGGIGTVQLPISLSDAVPVYGYDMVRKQQIVGVSTSLLTLFKEVDGYVGAVGVFHSEAPNVEPYLALGSDVKKYVPILNQFSCVQLHGFGRYSTSSGGRSFGAHLGAGLALAYKY